MIFLSICIPTYNRDSYLKNTIESILKSESFNSGEVEIVVSDNASTDKTEKVVAYYVGKYDNIMYVRNNSNIGVNENSFNALSYGKGLYKKLTNDTYVFFPDGIDFMVDVIKRERGVKRAIFFTNRNNDAHRETEIVKSIDELMQNVSFDITSAHYHGIWKSEIKKIAKLNVTDFFFILPFEFEKLLEDKAAVVINKPLFFLQTIKKNKDVSYGVFDVFYNRLFNIYRSYVNRGLMSTDVFDFLEKDILFNYFLPKYLLAPKKMFFGLNKNDFKENVFLVYSGKQYFSEFLRVLKINKIRQIIQSFFYVEKMLKKSLKKLVASS